MSPAETVEVCANIGPAERRKRNIAGVIGSTLTLLMVGGLVETHAGWPLRLLVALPAFIGAIGFLQARAHTCVAFVSKNVQAQGDAAPVAVTDEKAKVQLARQARAVYVQSALATAAVVGLTLLLP